MDDLIRHLRSHEPDPVRAGRRVRSEIRRGDVRADRGGVRPQSTSCTNNAGVSGPVVFGSAYEESHFDEYREAGQRPPHRFLDGVARGGEDHGGAAGRRDDRPWWGPSTARASTTTSCTPTRGRLPYTSRSPPNSPSGTTSRGRSREGDYRALPQPVGGLDGADSTGKRRFRQGVEGARPHRAQRSPEALERDTLDRTVGHAFVDPRDFAALALEVVEGPFRRTIGGVRLPMGGVTYEQPPASSPPRRALAVPRPGRQGRAAGGRRSPSGDVP